MTKNKAKIISSVIDSKINQQKLRNYDYDFFKKKHGRTAMVLFFAIFLVFVLLLLKNISYPLFWADESMTAIGSERVLQYGYPKVHDGKNIFYDLRHSNTTLGINEKDDAYIGGTGWGHYYYGVIGYKIANMFDDIYTKTGVYRLTFAVLGLLGLLILAYSTANMLYKDSFTKWSFIGLFFSS